MLSAPCVSDLQHYTTECQIMAQFKSPPLITAPPRCPALLQYSYSKHRDALKPLTFMNEPLLMPAAGEEGSKTGREPAQQPGPPGLLRSKLWWTGAVLQVMTVALAVLTVLTVTGVLPSP